MLKTYRVKDRVSDDLVTQLLFNRGIKDEKEISNFLNPDFINHLHDPFLLPDMDVASDRILSAIKSNEKIGIWSDYDADGIPGGAVLHDFFKLIGFNNFTNYIPDRHTEGYGLNKEGISELNEGGVKLLITIDCGIRDLAHISYARLLGIEVIVTDHHEPAEELPEAFAIVNPKLKDSKYPEKILCGSGVVWKLIEAILSKKRNFIKDGQPFELSQGKEKWLLDLVGLATLSDMVPLVGENRALAHFGLSVLRKNRRPGLRRLFQMLKINKDSLTEDDLTFLITPRINAASRMGKPIDAFNLLTAQNEEDADSFARHLDSINNERKGVVAGIVKEAKKKIKERFENKVMPQVIVLGNPIWRPALLGLAANSIVEEYNRPVFLWGREGGEFIKGSCRSDGATDLVEIMENAKGVFLEFGGHKLSGGFSMDHERIHTFEEAIIEASAHVVSQETIHEVDAEISLKEVNENSANQINTLAPFGVGNEKPVFIIRNVIPEKVDRFGKAKEHLSVNLIDGSYKTRAISFFTAPDQFGDSLKEGIKTNVVANIEKSDFGGRREIRLRIVDFFK